jgi:hypothetical protein
MTNSTLYYVSIILLYNYYFATGIVIEAGWLWAIPPWHTCNWFKKNSTVRKKYDTSKIFLYFFIIKKKSFKFNSTNHKHEQFLKINLKK